MTPTRAFESVVMNMIREWCSHDCAVEYGREFDTVRLGGIPLMTVVTRSYIWVRHASDIHEFDMIDPTWTSGPMPARLRAVDQRRQEVFDQIRQWIQDLHEEAS